MAPYTHVGLALSAAPGGHIRFGSLEFADIDGSAPASSLSPGQALRLGDLDFIADHLGQLHLSKGNVSALHIHMRDHELVHASSAIAGSDALEHTVDTPDSISEGNAIQPHIPTRDHGPVHAGPATINPDVLACRINAYLRVNPDPELS